MGVGVASKEVEGTGAWGIGWWLGDGEWDGGAWDMGVHGWLGDQYPTGGVNTTSA